MLLERMGERPAAEVCLPRASRTRFGATGYESGPVGKFAVAKIGERDGWRRAVSHVAGWRGGAGTARIIGKACGRAMRRC
jgi:hypothetical protein